MRQGRCPFAPELIEVFRWKRAKTRLPFNPKRFGRFSRKELNWRLLQHASRIKSAGADRCFEPDQKENSVKASNAVKTVDPRPAATTSTVKKRSFSVIKLG